jgi:release factor glutamine methyltransferase
MTITSALNWASTQFSPVDTAQLDAEILLAYALQKNRSHLYAWPAKILEPEEEKHFTTLVSRKLQGEPVAYITGTKEFWSLNFTVTPDTLIPRPETELLVELTLEKFKTNLEPLTIADLGTGCGAIAISIAHEKPQWQLHATDNSTQALQVAKNNAERLAVKNIFFHDGDWCDALPSTKFDAIISNPPYIAKGDSDMNQDVIESEPHSALIAEDAGLAAIRQIAQQAVKYLKSGGYLLIEHGHRQAEAVTQIFQDAGFGDINVYKDLADKDRVTVGRFSANIATC